MCDIRKIFLGKRSVFILVVLGLFVINAIWVIPTLQSTRASASVFALTVAERVQSEINGSLENALNETVGVSGEVDEEPMRISTAFRNLLLRNKIFKSVALVGQNGKELVRVDLSGMVSPEKFIDQLRNPSLYLALQGTPKFGLPLISLNGELHMTLAVPIPKREGLIDKVIIAELNVQNLLSIIQSPKIGHGHVYVLDRDGVEILHPDIARIMQRRNFSTRAIVKKVLVDGATADGLARDDGYVNDDGEETFTVGMPIPVVKWGVFVEQPRATALEGLQQTIVLAIATSLLAMTIFLVIAFSTIKLRAMTIRDIEQAEKIEQLIKARSEFLYVASHQLRTPVSVITGTLSLLQEDMLNKLPAEKRKLLLDGIFVKAKKLTHIINDILQASEMDIVDFKLSNQIIQPIDVRGMVARICADLKEEAEKKHLLFEYPRSGSASPLIVQGQERYLEQALANLIDNAIKYTPHGFVRVELAENDGSVIIKVRDSGIGIPFDDQPKMFEKFKRGKNAEDAYTDGSGLGLFIVKKVIEAHPGGRIYFRSAGENKGTTFVVEMTKYNSTKRI